MTLSAVPTRFYEAVMETSDGAVTYTLLRGARFRKDIRLLPAGSDKATASADVAPAGDAAADGNFLGGGDDLLYRVNRAGRTGPFSIAARLLYQTVSYAFAADLLEDAPADLVAKRMLFRAVGPGLGAFGVAGALAQPTLTLYRGSQVVATNTNWTTSTDAIAIRTAAASVSAFALANGDSALVATLPPGSYAAQVSSPGATTGVTLIEVYELP